MAGPNQQGGVPGAAPTSTGQISQQPAMMSVQVPVSTPNGVMMQTIQVPVQQQPQNMGIQVVPQLIQTSSGVQQVMVQVPQIPSGPQIAQIVGPNGQLQQVQVVGNQATAMPPTVGSLATTCGSLGGPGSISSTLGP